MALWWDRLKAGRFWARTGQISEPTDQQADLGWGYVQDGQPYQEDFNARDQWSDRADFWLYQQIAGVIGRAGASPAEVGPNQLADALRAILSHPPALFVGAGVRDYVVPSNCARVFVFCVGPGGGSTGCNDYALLSGAGGGGGGAAIGWYPVAPEARIAVTVGNGGPGGTTSGQNGGTSSFGNLCSASGGTAGFSSTAVAPAGGAGGVGVGGLINLAGSYGGDGSYTVKAPLGYGGASVLGGSVRAGTTVLPSTTPGSGGAAPYNNAGAFGSKGADGLVLVLPVA